MEICDRLKVDPFEAMVKAAQEVVMPLDRVTAWEKVCAYIHPKRKAMEVTNKLDPAVIEEAEALLDLSDEELLKVAQSELKRLKGGGVQ